MNSIPKRILISSGAAILALLALNLWIGWNKALDQSPTSFGVMRDGYKAAYDLLTELHYPVTRSFRRAKLLPSGQTLWFVVPSFLGEDKPTATEDAGEILDWVSRGGSAVIFGDAGADWGTLGLTRGTEKGEQERTLIQGDLARAPRWLMTPNLLHFSDLSKKDAASRSEEHVRLTAGGKPFAIEISRGKGHLVAIADSSFLRNENLADGDASVVLVDLVRGFGAPAFDERSHGLAPPASLTFAVLDSRAILPILVGTLLAVLSLLSQRVWPRRTLDDNPGLPAPSIASFVESLSILYSRSADPAAVFRAYRGAFLRRLRRQIGLRADFPEDLLLARIARDRSLSDDTRKWLTEPISPSDSRDLVIAVRALESYPRPGHEDRA